MWNKFLRNPLHIVKDYELRKLLWQSWGTAVCKKYLMFRDTLNSDFLCFTIHSVKLIIQYCIRSGSSTPSNIIERFVRFVMSYLPTGNEIIMYQNICFQML